MMGISDQQFAEMFFNPYTFTRRISQDVEAQSHLLVVNRRGNVEIRGSDQRNIGAVIQETVWAENESAARKVADRLQFHLAHNGGQYELASNLDSLPFSGRAVRLDMVVRVPQSTASEITVDDGDVTASGLKGNQTLTSRRGDVRADNIQGILQIHKSRGTTSVSKLDGSVEIEGRGGDIEVREVTGSVTVEGNFSGASKFGDVAQTLRFNSSRTTLTAQKLTGNLTMDMGNLTANGVGGPFELSTRDKDILLENFKLDVKITNSNGDVHLQTMTPPTHPIEVDLKRGEITLSLPASSNFQVDAVSHNGGVSCDFPGLNVSKGPPMPTIKGSYGNNGPMIRLSSTYGGIHLLRVETKSAPARSATAASRIEYQPAQKSWPFERPAVRSVRGQPDRILNPGHAYRVRRAIVSKNEGKDIWTQSPSSMVVIPSATRPAILKAMAMRWSP
jgi:putative adhesin